MSQEFLGYRYDLEDREFNTAFSSPFTLQMMGDEPLELDVRTWWAIRNQGNQGSCFPKGTQVFLSNGNICNIEDIQIGDTVLTHKGTNVVVDTMNRSYTGKMYTFKVGGWKTITSTEDHIFRVFRDNTIIWRQAKDILETDQLILTNGPTYAEKTEYDTALLNSNIVDKKNDNYILSKNKRYNRYLKFDDLECYILGLFCAEGSYDKTEKGVIKTLSFTINKKESHLINKIKEFGKKYGLKTYERPYKNSKGYKVRLYGKHMAIAFYNLVGEYSNQKRVPSFIMSGNHNQKKSFLKGYFDGDANYVVDGKCLGTGNTMTKTMNTICASTASSTLALQCGILLNSLGIKANLSSVVDKRTNRFDQNRISLSGQSIGFFLNNIKLSQKTNKPTFCVEGQLRKIKNISITDVENITVYDFTVDEDHSFCANGFLVHNCRGHGLAANARYCSRAKLGELDLDADGIIAEKQDDDFSAQWCYIQSQKQSNIKGDQGATMDGGIKVGLDLGIAREVEWPYPNPVYYDTKVPEIAKKNAANFKFARYTKFQPGDIKGIKTWLASGQGGIDWGKMWPLPFLDNCLVDGSINERQSLGGHCTAILGYIKAGTLLKELPNLKKYLKDEAADIFIGCNSHGVGAQHKGFYYLTERGMAACMEHRWTETLGWSDMIVPRKRTINFNENGIMG